LLGCFVQVVAGAWRMDSRERHRYGWPSSDLPGRRMTELPVERWIVEVAPGRSLIDIGGIGEWSVNERVSQAVAAGASRVAIADIEPATSAYWTAFHDRMAQRGIARTAYESLPEIDITRPGLADRLPVFDVVHSTGILYHCANPVGALDNLRQVTGRFLIVNTVICPERIDNAAGSLRLPGSAALFLPGISEPERDVLRLHYRAKFGWNIDDVAPRPGTPDAVMPHLTPQGLSCWPYWWLLTIPAFRGLLQTLRFEIRDEWTWEDHAHFVLCEQPG